MKLPFCVFLSLSSLLAQTSNKRIDEKQATIRQRGAEALTRERARSKIDLCAKAQPGGNAAIGACLAAEGKATEQEYLTYVSSIGALLRLPTLGSSETKPPSTPQNLPFDTAEGTWRRYRDESCTSVASQWDGGDQAPIAYANCRLTLTWNHMNELAALYANLWH
jgi:uncharacterized protein YecT (DUF1311 family)